MLGGTFSNGLATVALSVDSTQKVGRKSTPVETTVTSSEKREPNGRTGEKNENEEREKEGRGREVVNNHHVHLRLHISHASETNAHVLRVAVCAFNLCGATWQELVHPHPEHRVLFLHNDHRGVLHGTFLGYQTGLLERGPWWMSCSKRESCEMRDLMQ